MKKTGRDDGGEREKISQGGREGYGGEIGRWQVAGWRMEGMQGKKQNNNVSIR